MNDVTGKIGIFDSGFGGLTIMKSIVDALPQYDYIYLGDTARTPYGTRSQNVVFAFTQQAVDFLFAEGCELIIIACNTASADALPCLQEHYKNHPYYCNRRILGVIIPTAEYVTENSNTQPIGVLATEGTVASEAFTKEIIKCDPHCEVVQIASPLLVPLIENGEIDSEITELILQKYLSQLTGENISHLILGCTHYSILAPMIRKLLGENITVVEEGPVVADKLTTYLDHHEGLEKSLSRGTTRIFYTTDTTDRFATLGSTFFGTEIAPKKVSLL